MVANNFSDLLIKWQYQSGRNSLPWQVSDPYKIWVSEIMLQQTQVATVLTYFSKFIQAFPTIQHLGQAKIEDVLTQWAGLGYYTRAQNLHASARYILQKYGNDFPRTRLQWQQLKGVGRSTASAIVAFAFNQREAILDGNVKRVLARLAALPIDISKPSNEKQLWKIAELLLPTNEQHMPTYTQGLMDIGATICIKNNPLCAKCPVMTLCQAAIEQKTHLLPIRNKKIKIKQLDLFWLIILAQRNRILLTSKEYSGIWPGLLIPPTFEKKSEMLQWLTKKSFDTHDINQLPIIQHQLTHRKLIIHPFEVTQQDQLSNNFYALNNVVNERIPKPLKSFITQRYLT